MCGPDRVFNDRVTEIFKHDYVSPRSPYCSLQIPLHGYGDWCYAASRCRSSTTPHCGPRPGQHGRFVSPQGIPFATPGPGEQPNIAFTSRWDNFPAEIVVPLAGQRAMRGSSSPARRIPCIRNWTTARWSWPTPTARRHDCRCTTRPPGGPSKRTTTRHRRVLHSGSLSAADRSGQGPGHDPRFAARSRSGHCVSLTMRCLANEVVVGLMSATLQRP